MHTLIVHESFFNSSVLPKVCLFSGRTDGIRQSVLYLRDTVADPANSGSKEKTFCSYPILTHHAPLRQLWWLTLRNLAYGLFAFGILATVLFVIAAIVFCVQAFQHNFQGGPGMALVTGIYAVYMTLTAWLSWYVKKRSVRIEIYSPHGQIRLSFPDTLRATAELYLESYNRYLRAHQVEPVQLLSDTENWDEAIVPGWDQDPDTADPA